MYFFRDKPDSDESSLIPSSSFFSELQDCGAIIKKPVDEICLHDIIFDIKFLKVYQKEESNTFKGVGFFLKAYDTRDNSYNAFVYSKSEIHFVNPDYHDYVYQSLDDASLFPN